jgi:hypothetical protein
MKEDVYPDIEKTPIVMCAACWRVQVPEEELAFELDQWVDPTTFMAQSHGGAGDYLIMDGYCDGCLSEILFHIQDVKTKTAHERLNA